MDAIISTVQSTFYGIGPFIILLGLLIFVHELGHFLVAKFYNVRVEVFSLGFGKKIFEFERGETTYCISAIPLGGYVKMFGDDPTADISDSDKARSFLHKPVGQRIAIVLAGPLMNLFFAAFLLVMVAMVGERKPDAILGDIGQKTAAYLAGFRSGDQIKSVNGERVSHWQEMQSLVYDNPNRDVEFGVLRDDTEIKISATPKLEDNSNPMLLRSQIGVIDGLSYISQAAVVGLRDPLSPAGQAGFKSIEMIKTVDGAEVRNFRDLEPALQLAAQDGTISFELVEQTVDGKKNAKPRTVQLNELDLVAGQPLLEQLGIESSELYLFRPREGDPADRAGLRHGDKLVAINGKKLSSWSDVVESVSSFKEEDKLISVQYLRAGLEQSVQVTPERRSVPGRTGQITDRYTVGILTSYTSTVAAWTVVNYSNPLKATQVGVKRTWDWVKIFTVTIGKLFTAEISPKNVGGIISIGRAASDSFELGLSPFLRMMALISLNLFLINLLPVPMLDGGHLVFFSVEAIRGAPMSMRKMEIAQQVGLVLLLFLMVFALFNDITNYLGSQW